ncbi:MAG: phosphoribosylformylglycinamidine synthase subunit PurS [Candidatus Kapabacteria bacterium]|nr:phosphoribosylformylglycinamidine synthase subunit PurS [Candidatus Kapabacteria bacterium]MBX7154164.1 phosphoribosylformylglycinamidine synthase subunit PurS [Bacteroidota bacterium]
MKYHASVDITLRQGILDVQGKTVEHALHSMEFGSISNVRIGKFVELNIEAPTQDSAYEAVKAACEKLIANPIMEDFHITVKEVA